MDNLHSTNPSFRPIPLAGVLDEIDGQLAQHLISFLFLFQELLMKLMDNLHSTNPSFRPIPLAGVLDEIDGELAQHSSSFRAMHHS